RECYRGCRCAGPNSTAGCAATAVVGRGMQYRLAVFPTPDGRGLGVRAVEAIPTGTFVYVYAGEVVCTDTPRAWWRRRRQQAMAAAQTGVATPDSHDDNGGGNYVLCLREHL